MDVSYKYKVILLGDAGVGKTSLFTRIKTGKFLDVESFTTKPDSYDYCTTIGRDRIQVTLWDTAGFENSSRSPPYSYYRRATGVLLVYSVENSQAFENLQTWTTQAKYLLGSPPSIKWALIGNKCDLPSEVDSTRIKARCEQMQATVSCPVSAKTGHNVMKALNDFINAIHRDNKQLQDNVPSTSIHLTPEETKKYRCVRNC